MTPMPDTTLTSAIDQLQNHQTQLDMDGVAVGVSRQALEIVLDALARAGLEAGKAEERLPIETAINVSYGTDHGRFSVFLHWDGNGFTYAYGASVDEALKLAISDMKRLRADTARHSGEAA